MTAVLMACGLIVLAGLAIILWLLGHSIERLGNHVSDLTDMTTYLADKVIDLTEEMAEQDEADDESIPVDVRPDEDPGRCD